MSVLSAYCVFILLHCVSLCSVVFLYSLWVTFCLPVLTSRPFFQCEALLLHLYLKRCPRFVEVLFSCCIKAFSLFFISRLRPHILCWGFVLVLYWGFVLIFYFEALASYFILRLRPHILNWGFVLVLYQGFVLIFYFEASASYFILRLRPHILYWGFVLILYFKASSSWLIWGFVLIVIYWGYVPQFEALVVIVVGPCCFVCTAYLVCLQWYVCGSVCLFLSRVTRCKYYLVWISIHIFNLLCLFFSLHSCNPLFWFTCSYYFSLNFIRLLRVVITPSVTTRNNRMNFRLLLF